jgi:hypothetical protein
MLLWQLRRLGSGRRDEQLLVLFGYELQLLQQWKLA